MNHTSICSDRLEEFDIDADDDSNDAMATKVPLRAHAGLCICTQTSRYSCVAIWTAPRTCNVWRRACIFLYYLQLRRIVNCIIKAMLFARAVRPVGVDEHWFRFHVIWIRRDIFIAHDICRSVIDVQLCLCTFFPFWLFSSLSSSFWKFLVNVVRLMKTSAMLGGGCWILTLVIFQYSLKKCYLLATHTLHVAAFCIVSWLRRARYNRW